MSDDSAEVNDRQCVHEVAQVLKRLYPQNPDVVIGSEARNIVAALREASLLAEGPIVGYATLTRKPGRLECIIVQPEVRHALDTAAWARRAYPKEEHIVAALRLVSEAEEATSEPIEGAGSDTARPMPTLRDLAGSSPNSERTPE